jgi:thiamine-phosphate pyrophosphorylase
VTTDQLAGVHVLLDDDPRWGVDPVEQARLVCTAAPPVVQLRAKLASDRQVLEWAREIRKLTRECGSTFIVNDRFDIALACEADGVHLGWDDLPPSSLPAAARERLIVGRSTHTLDQVERALRESVDYIALGPIFGTTSKESEYAARGLALLAAAVQAASRSGGSTHCLVAIGGITRENCASVLESGALAVAVISAVLDADDPAAATSDLMALARGAAALRERRTP